VRIIGLTGGIASGKSTVARILERLGGAIIDADQLAREVVMAGEPAYDAIVAEFGDGVLNPDRTINRGVLGKIVFADPAARGRLERITHPAIARKAEQKLAALRVAGIPVVFYMAPLLIEAGVTSRVDEIWVVYADRETQVARLMQRDGIARPEALQRLAAQLPMEEKRTYGKVVIDNRGTPEETERQVREIWAKEFKGTGTRDEGPGTRVQEQSQERPQKKPPQGRGL
jgi:dephospho-CoA kinase